MNQKRCFILQHKVKRIGWFVVIEIVREWIVEYKGCRFQIANYFFGYNWTSDIGKLFDFDWILGSFCDFVDF